MARSATIPQGASLPVRIVQALVTAINDWWDERRAISQLRELDERMLHDMGISRSEIVAAVRGEIYRP
ncbi:DUF1127 domain-containing protein [Ferruginivarius sediminum]|uniref:DUF1127 domain-containing protein n=2 Tax=Ferruginivarius sediminum TaxID=2661937 RepID=A0A369T788_9PROT|nr:DUF1127 domain-containing protein [Ferruginivarius sediminum]